MDTGDYIVVVNVEKLRVTGAKADGQEVLPPLDLPGRHLRDQLHQAAGAPSGSRPEARGEGHAAEGPLGYAMIKKLKIYAGPAHPHSSQQPKALEI